MKYIFVLPELKRSGPNNVVKNMITSKAFSKFDIFLICLRVGEDIDYIDEFKEYKNVQILNLKKGGFFSKLKCIKNLVKKISPDVIHSHGFFPDIYVSLLMGNFKIVSTIHNIIYQDYSSRYGFNGYFYAFIHYIFLKFGSFHKIFGCSANVSNSLYKIIKNKNILHVDNGIDIARFNCLNSMDKLELRKKNNLKCDILIAFCGGLDRVKKVPELVDFYINTIDNLNFKFIIIGDGPDLNKIQENEKIIKIGKVNNPSFYLEMSDIVVSNSSSEGYPMAILEALASGCKVFLSEIPAHNAIINKYKNCAFIIDNLNKEFMLKVINNKLDSDQLYSISSDKMANEYLSKL